METRLRRTMLENFGKSLYSGSFISLSDLVVVGSFGIKIGRVSDRSCTGRESDLSRSGNDSDRSRTVANRVSDLF
jgi:hypothetical protein